MSQVVTRRFAAIVAAIAITAIGSTAIGAAHADSPLMVVTPSSGLTDGEVVAVTISGIPPTPLGRINIAECANAYGDGSPLAAINPITDCETSTWINGPNGTVPFTAKQTGIGQGNRACVAAPPALWACYVSTPSGINVPAFPSPVDISFQDDLIGATPAPTATTIEAVGTPLGTGKVPHAFVTVSDGSFTPDGAVTVTEGNTTLASGTLSGGSADLVLSTLALGTHPLVAHFVGNGSFLASDSTSSDMTIIGANNISIGDAGVVGGAGGSRSMYFPIVASNPIPIGPNFTVHYQIVSDTAQPGIDYVNKALSGIVTLKPGQNSKVFVVHLLNNPSLVGTKMFTVTLSLPSAGWDLRRSQATGSIIAPASGSPTVNVANVSTPEGDSGKKHAMKFTVTLSSVQSETVTVTLQIRPFSATSTDYSGAYVRKVVFKAGTTSKPLSVPIISDSTHELDERFLVVLVSVAQTTPTVQLGTSAIGTILSDE